MSETREKKGTASKRNNGNGGDLGFEADLFTDAEKLCGKIRANDEEAATFAETRDHLLPKLMSGEIQVRNVASLAGEAA